jgi:hypothetical protein
MRKQRLAGALITLTLLSTPLACLAQAQPNQRPAPQCISVTRIDHTKAVDDHTILFFMKGGDVLRNTLRDRCVGLTMNIRGFTYVTSDDQICANLQRIRVNDNNEVCLLGSFTREPKQP